MLNPVYIRAARAVCAHDTFSGNSLPATLAEVQDNALYYHQPPYQDYFTIMQLRRMSRITRIGMVTAIECLKDAGVSHPDAIITGTGKGSLSDTEKFMQSIREFHEGTLNPTPFIQSTYNALNGMIGLHHNTNSYNTTYVHRGFSLENALLDAMLLFSEGRAETALAGSFEEMTAEHYIIKQKLGYWKQEKSDRASLLSAATPGSVAGEGTFMFLLQNHPTAALAKLNGVRMVFEPKSSELVVAMEQLLSAHGITAKDLDLVILGRNGDSRFEHYYDTVSALADPSAHQLAFKHICGEFDTAAGFALWSAAQMLHRGEIWDPMRIHAGTRDQVSNVLIYNNYYGRQHAFYLLQATK